MYLKNISYHIQLIDCSIHWIKTLFWVEYKLMLYESHFYCITSCLEMLHYLCMVHYFTSLFNQKKSLFFFSTTFLRSLHSIKIDTFFLCLLKTNLRFIASSVQLSCFVLGGDTPIILSCKSGNWVRCWLYYIGTSHVLGGYGKKENFSEIGGECKFIFSNFDFSMAIVWKFRWFYEHIYVKRISKLTILYLFHTTGSTHWLQESIIYTHRYPRLKWKYYINRYCFLL